MLTILLFRLLFRFCFNWEDISNTRDSVSSAIQTPWISSTLFWVFGYPDETLLLVFDILHDDVNLCNTLTNKIHKITLLYYQLANIQVKYRSKLNSIHLLGVCKTDCIKMYGINHIFELLVKELKSLGTERGYPFRVFGGYSCFEKGCPTKA